MMRIKVMMVKVTFDDTGDDQIDHLTKVGERGDGDAFAEDSWHQDFVVLFFWDKTLRWLFFEAFLKMTLATSSLVAYSAQWSPPSLTREENREQIDGGANRRIQ